MKNLITSFFLILALTLNSASAALIPTAPTITVGGRVFTDLANLKILVCYTDASVYCTFRNATSGGTSGYVVPAGKSLHIYAIHQSVGITTAAGVGVKLFYSDNDGGQNANVGAFNGLTYQGGVANYGTLYTVGGATGIPNAGQATHFVVPTGKYPGMQTVRSASEQAVLVYGYEE